MGAGVTRARHWSCPEEARITEGVAFQWELEPPREGKAYARDVPGSMEREGEIPWFLPSSGLRIPIGASHWPTAFQATGQQGSLGNVVP